MKKVEKHCKKLHEKDPNLYHKEIVQIHFNTWHYVDANLWVSLVYRIFDKLNEKKMVCENTMKCKTKNLKLEVGGVSFKQTNKKHETPIFGRRCGVLKNF